MNRAILFLGIFFLSGCAMTPTQKKWTGFVAGALIVGAIAAERSENGEDQRRVSTPAVDCQANPQSCF